MEDEIDAALTDLQTSLEGSSISTANDITQIPELQDYLKFFKSVTIAIVGASLFTVVWAVLIACRHQMHSDTCYTVFYVLVDNIQ